MKSDFKRQYLLLQCLFWISGSIMFGFSTLFLQYKGLSNTEIGIASGCAGVTIVFLQMLVDNLVQKLRFMTPKRMIMILMVLTIVMYTIMWACPLPVAGLMICYIITNSLFSCASPLTITLGMDYLNQGHKLNFLFSRGMGSCSYAVSAFVLGFMIEYYCAGVLPYAFAITQIVLCILILRMKDTHDKSQAAGEDRSEGFLFILKNNPVIRTFAIAFTLSFMANSIVNTYMVNVVYQVGGNDASFGICCFMNAVSEFPAMLLCNYLLKKYSCRMLLKISSFCFIIKMLVLFFASSLAVVYFGYLLQSVSWGAFLAISVFLVNTEMKTENRLKGQSIFSSLVLAVGGSSGNLLGGYLQDTWGLKVTIAVCIVISIVGFMCSMTVKKAVETATES